MVSKAILVMAMIAYVEARFGQEQVPIQAVSQVQGGAAGAAPTIAGAAISDLLGAANSCDKLQRADQIVTELGGGADAIAAAIGMVTAEKNTNPSANGNAQNVCDDPTLPATAELRGITPLIDPDVDVDGAAAALSQQSAANPLDATGLSVFDLMSQNGLGDLVQAQAGAGGAAGGAAAQGNGAANNNNNQGNGAANGNNNNQGNGAANGNNNNQGNGAANGNNNNQGNGAANGNNNNQGNGTANGNNNNNQGNGAANDNNNNNSDNNNQNAGNAADANDAAANEDCEDDAAAGNQNAGNANNNQQDAGNGNNQQNAGNANDNQQDAGNAADDQQAAGDNAGAAAGQEAAGLAGADFGQCTPTIIFEGGQNGRPADEFTFQIADELARGGQGEALNPNIITNALCNQLTNVCGANDAAITACEDAKAQVEAAGTRDKSTADLFNSALGFAGAVTNPSGGPENPPAAAGAKRRHARSFRA